MILSCISFIKFRKYCLSGKIFPDFFCKKIYFHIYFRIIASPNFFINPLPFFVFSAEISSFAGIINILYFSR